MIMPSLVVSYSHSDDDIDRTIEAIDGALAVYARALADGTTDRLLVGPPSRARVRPALITLRARAQPSVRSYRRRREGSLKRRDLHDPKNFNVLIKVSSRLDDVVSSRENYSEINPCFGLWQTVRSTRSARVCR